jgi:hypothetical protein
VIDATSSQGRAIAAHEQQAAQLAAEMGRLHAGSRACAAEIADVRSALQVQPGRARAGARVRGHCLPVGHSCAVGCAFAQQEAAASTEQGAAMASQIGAILAELKAPHPVPP